MFLDCNIRFEDSSFYDCEPEEKDPEELAVLILLEASGKRVSMKKYNQRDVALCARRLILKGYIRGTVRDRFDCSWSRLTKKGFVLLKTMENQNYS